MPANLVDSEWAYSITATIIAETARRVDSCSVRPGNATFDLQGKGTMKPRNYRLFWLVLSVLSTHQLLATVSVAGDPLQPNPAVKPGTLGSDVNPFIGTGGVRYLCGNNFPGATVPFGMVRLSPDTVSLPGTRASNSSGYYYSDPRILGFSHTRLAGTGATDGGTFLVIPCTAETAKSHHRGLNSAYSHRQERAFPGYFGVTLPGEGITAELTATRRVGVHRYTFLNTKVPHILIDLTSTRQRAPSPATCASCRKRGEIEGSARTFGTFSKRYGGVSLFCRPIQSTVS